MLKVGLIVSIVLALASMGAAGWFYMQAQSGTGVRGFRRPEFDQGIHRCRAESPKS